MKALLVLMGMEIGGAETHVLELARGLKKQGVEVMIASNGGAYVKELEQNGIRHFEAPLQNRNPLNMLKSLWKLFLIIKRERPDVVHGHARIPSFLLGILNKFVPFRFITTAHWVFDTSGMLKHLTNWGWRTIAVSEDIKQYLIDNYGILPQDITVTINGIDMEKFAPGKQDAALVQELGLQTGKRRILYISRMDTTRSLAAHHLIAVAPRLKQQEDIEIIIVGGGDDFDAIVKEATAANQQNGEPYIYCTGARTDIARFMAVSDFMVGVSRAALEAMSAGLPTVIAGNEGYIGVFDEQKLPDAIATNFCCRGMEACTPEKLGSDLLSLLKSDTEALQQLGGYGRAVIAERYSVDRMVQDNLRVYEEICAHGNRYHDIMISGYYGYQNSGDDALLSVMLEKIRQRQTGARFVVLSANPKASKKLYGVEAIHRFRYFRIKKQMRRCSMLISGGGSLIQDMTSSRSLYYYALIILLAKRAGLKVMTYANGIGPVNNPRNYSVARFMLQSADYITLRDIRSMDEMKKVGYDGAHVLVTADPVMVMQPGRDGKALLKQAGVPEGDYVGISVRDWENRENLIAEIADAADKLAEKDGLIPVFIPLHYPNDLKICRACLDAMRQKGYLLETYYNFRDMMSVVGACKFVIGMRLHSLMYATARGVPVVGVIYDPKVRGYLEYLEQTYQIEISSFAKDNLGVLYTLAEKLLASYPETTAALHKRVEILQKRESENSRIAACLLKGEKVELEGTL